MHEIEINTNIFSGISAEDSCETFSRGQHRQAMLKRVRNDTKRYHTAGAVDDIKVVAHLKMFKNKINSNDLIAAQR